MTPTDPDHHYVIHLVDGVPGVSDIPELQEHVGRYVTEYKPELARKGEQWIWTTDDVDQALGFSDIRNLHDLYRTSVGTRPDGKPDRPITVYTVQVSKRKEFKAVGPLSMLEQE